MTKYSTEQTAANRAAWAAALRSGEYEQGNSALVDELPDGTRAYCCLGVACELAVKEGILQPWGSLKVRDGDHKIHGYPVATHEFSSENSVLPGEVAEWLGITRRGRTTRTYKDSYRDDDDNLVESKDELPANLIYYNDEVKATFADIADIIEGPDLIIDPDPDDVYDTE